MNRKPYKSLGRDLFFDLKCTCPHPRYVGTPIDYIMKGEVKLHGYADANFFDIVNASPRVGHCQCGREYQVQWFRDGVEAAFTDTLPKGEQP